MKDTTVDWQERLLSLIEKFEDRMMKMGRELENKMVNMDNMIKENGRKMREMTNRKKTGVK
jgi:hypothetical protein